MKRKNKSYVKPMKSFEAGRIKDENELKKKYALKNKREIWKTQALVDYFRGRAKALAAHPHEEQKVLFNKLNGLGIKVEGIADILDLKVENLLKRRLPTIVAEKKIANTVKQARQMVVHKRITIDGKIVSAPSYIVSVAEEEKIKARKKSKAPKPAPAEEPAESNEEKIEEGIKEVVEEETKVPTSPETKTPEEKEEAAEKVAEEVAEDVAPEVAKAEEESK